MKTYLLLLLTFALKLSPDANSKPAVGNLIDQQQAQLAEYAGKYRLNQPGGPAPFLLVSVKDDSLIFTETWNHNKTMTLKHLSGDNFIVEGLDWSIQFMRAKDKSITEVLVMGRDHWVKVKN